MSTQAPVERIVDRAAAHATPALLAVRDRLLVALAFSAGMYEAICFRSFGKVFTAFQTGNIVFLGLGAAGTRPPFGPDPLRVVTSLVAFAAGAALAVRILKAFDGDEEVEDTDVFAVWPRRVSITLGVALLVQVGFLAVWMAASPSNDVSNILIGLNAFAMGMQMNAIRSLHVPGISTTAATATLISWVSGIATWSLKAPAARRLTGILVGMPVGAIVGDWMLSHAHTYAPVLPALVIALVIAIASIALKQKPATPSAISLVGMENRTRDVQSILVASDNTLRCGEQESAREQHRNRNVRQDPSQSPLGTSPARPGDVLTVRFRSDAPHGPSRVEPATTQLGATGPSPAGTESRS